MRLPAFVFRTLRGAALLSAGCAVIACSVISRASAQDSLAGSASQAQSSSPLGSDGFSNSGSDRRASNPGAAGGGAMQDWSTVMMLISQTVDPDEWRDFGGTGNSTMIPYPNGVWLDAKGHLKRLDRKGQMMPSWTVGASRQQWRAGSGLRTISLKQLDAALASMQIRGLQPTAQMLQLAGITHIQYVAVDVENQDVLLSGPAAKVDGDENGFLLEDMRTLVALMNKQTAPLGCSLDPDNQGILAAQSFLSEPNVIGRLSRTPQAVADQIKAKVGPHSVNIFGIDPSSSTALALVDADEHMKRVGLGLASTVPKIKTYFDHLDRKGAAPAQSLIRWWFAYNDAPILVNEASNFFELPKQTVAVMSEQQWVNAQGDRQATGAADEAADAFAAEMTEKLDVLRATQPAYARLQGIFELGLALQLAIESSKQPSLGDWFPNLPVRSSSNPSKNGALGRQTPKSVEGVTAWDRLKNGTVVAVISGGVKIEPAVVASPARWQSQSHISRPSNLDSARISSAQWWWD